MAEIFNYLFNKSGLKTVDARLVNSLGIESGEQPSLNDSLQLRQGQRKTMVVLTGD